jgi:hypothetical protein
VSEEPQHDEVGVDLAVHHVLEAELEVHLPGERGAVAEYAELVAVADKASLACC